VDDFALFFGEPALTLIFLSKLIKKTKAKVFCGFVQRLPNARGYKIIVEEAMSDIL
jgi:Lauroyl/myristoyl acyltransferase